MDSTLQEVVDSGAPLHTLVFSGLLTHLQPGPIIHDMNIRPGLGTRIVTDIDVIKERIIVKGSTVYEVEEPIIILAQTDPPILKSMLHEEVIVTYLENAVRYGFTAELVEFISYGLDSIQVKALMMRRTGQEKLYNVRMSYRVGPTDQSSISMSVFANKVDIVDISLGGTKFAYGMPFLLEPDDIAQIGLEIDGRAPHPRGAHPENLAGRPRRRQRRPLVRVSGVRQYGERDDRAHSTTQDPQHRAGIATNGNFTNLKEER